MLNLLIFLFCSLSSGYRMILFVSYGWKIVGTKDTMMITTIIIEIEAHIMDEKIRTIIPIIHHKETATGTINQTNMDMEMSALSHHTRGKRLFDFNLLNFKKISERQNI